MLKHFTLDLECRWSIVCQDMAQIWSIHYYEQYQLSHWNVRVEL
jgi:hypothetical protein